MLLSLLDEVDENLYPALEQFLENFDDDLESLNRHREEQNRDAIRKIASGIQQSASVFGLDGIEEEAGELAEMTGSENWEAIDRKVQLITDTLNAAHDEFERESDL